MKSLITFKDEDDGIGPVVEFTPEARPTEGPRGLIFPLVEYGTVDLDNGEIEHGWLTKSDALRLARELNADFVEL